MALISLSIIRDEKDLEVFVEGDMTPAENYHTFGGDEFTIYGAATEDGKTVELTLPEIERAEQKLREAMKAEDREAMLDHGTP